MSTALAVISLQIIVMPLISKSISIEEFGEALIIISIVNISGVVIGNTLNNIRLVNIQNKEVDKSNDYTLLLIGSFLVVISFWIIIYLSGILNINDLNFLGFLIIFNLLTIIRAYGNVYYRISLNFKKIFYHNLIYALSLLIGVFIFTILSEWIVVFLFAELASLIFILYTTNLLKELKKVRIKRIKVISRFLNLLLSSLLANISNYMDRYLLMFFIGPIAVTIFFSASVVGKIAATAFAPVTGVVLSYISTGKLAISKFKLISFNIALLISGIIISFLIFPLSEKMIQTLYPIMNHEYSILIFLCNIIFLNNGLLSISQSILIKFSNARNQVYIQMLFLLVYIVPTLLIGGDLSLIKFTYILLAAVFVKFIYINFIIYKTDFKTM